MERVSKDQYYLDIAKVVSERSTCLKRQYGAVIVKNDTIVATGYNGSPRGYANCCDIGYCKRLNVPSNSGMYDECNSVHAEQNAIIASGYERTNGATLYLYGRNGDTYIETASCPICKRMIRNAGIKEIVTIYVDKTFGTMGINKIEIK